MQDTKKINVFKTMFFFAKKYPFSVLLIFYFQPLLMFCIKVLINSRIIKDIIDKINNSSFNFSHDYYLVIFFALTVYPDKMLTALFRYFRHRCAAILREHVVNYYFQKVLKNPVSFFHNNMSGYLISKLEQVRDNVVNVTELILNTLALLTFSSIVFINFFSINKKLGLFFGIYFISFFTIYSFGFYKRRQLFKEVEKQEGEMVGNMNDVFTNIMNIKVFSKEKREKANIKKLTMKILQLKNKMWEFQIPLFIFSYICVSVASFYMIYIVIDLIETKQSTIGEGIFIINTLTHIIIHLVNFIEKFVLLFERIPKLQQSLEILENIPTITDHTKERFIATKGEIKFANVCFKYEEHLPMVFNELNISIKANEKVGIVGYSGSGKTSLVNLLLRFYDVNSGGIYLDGKNIKTEMTQEDLRKSITYISQEPILFHRSLWENLIYGIPANESITREKVIDACKKAECYDFIMQAENKFDTIVGERGIKLSGGQRQRVTIARAILKNSKCLILDEATSALDSLTEREIQKGLNELMKNKSVIVVAHRLSTLNNMDRIIVLDKGAIVENDTKENLLRIEGGLFRKMWEMQGNFM